MGMGVLGFIRIRCRDQGCIASGVAKGHLTPIEWRTKKYSL